MKQKYLLSLVFALVLFLPGCWGKKEPTLYVVNVLDKNLYDECHIKGSINVAYGDVKKWADGLSNKDVEIVMYCSNYACTGSGFAAKQLIDNGFTNVWAYEAGMHGWHAKGYPEECSVESSYLSAENKKPDEEDDTVPVITTLQLHQKMVNHGIFQ